MRKVQIYIARSGKAPFEQWMRSLRDKQTKARIFTRIDRVRLGNFGDCESVGAGVYELRIHFGPGYRVYFGLRGEEVVLLLCGGDKSTQVSDIEAERAVASGRNRPRSVLHPSAAISIVASGPADIRLPN